VLFKVGDVVVEAVQLHHLLEAGFSTSLCHGYAALIATGCLSQAFFILYPGTHTAFTEVLVDTVYARLLLRPILLHGLTLLPS
jgi:putative intracellular protease/amidase